MWRNTLWLKWMKRGREMMCQMFARLGGPLCGATRQQQFALKAYGDKVIISARKIGPAAWRDNYVRCQHPVRK